MYESITVLTKIYFNQNAESGEMIRDFFFPSSFRLLCTFQIYIVVFTKEMSQIWAAVSQGALTCGAVLSLHFSGSSEGSVWNPQATGISMEPRRSLTHNAKVESRKNKF